MNELVTVGRTHCAPFRPCSFKGGREVETMLDDIWDGVAVIIDGEVTYPGEGTE